MLPTEYLLIQQAHRVEGLVTYYEPKADRGALAKLERRVILHIHEAGKITAQLFMVKGSREDIDAVVASDPSVKHYTTKKDAQLDGLLAKMGTPTLTKIDDLYNKWKTQLGLDLKKHKHPTSGKNLYEYMKDELDHIPEGQQLCLDCGTLNVADAVRCNSCNADLTTRGKHHIRPFDILTWKEY